MRIAIIGHGNPGADPTIIAEFKRENKMDFMLDKITDKVEALLSHKFQKEIRVQIHQLPMSEDFEPLTAGMYFSTEKGLENVSVSGDIIIMPQTDKIQQ